MSATSSPDPAIAPFRTPALLRVLLADEHAIVREGLKLLINAQTDMEVVAEAMSGSAAVQAVEASRPDVVVMDVGRVILSASIATRIIKLNRPDTRVLALSTNEEHPGVSLMLKAGVSGYALKRSSADDLLRAIRTVAKGGVYLDPLFTPKIIEEFLRNSRRDLLNDV